MTKLPPGWSWEKFGDVVEDSQYGLSTAATPDGKTPLLRMNNIEDGKLILTDLVHVKVSQRELASQELQRDDLLFNRTNSLDLVGKTALFRESGTFVCASYLVRFRLRRDRVDPRFVSYVFNTAHSQRTLHQLATKAVAQANINPTVLQEMFRLPVPPLNEQAGIADILECWDGSIERLQKLISTKLARKKALVQQLLSGKKRFNEFVISAKYRRTHFGPFPSDWPVVHIGDVADEVASKNGVGHELPVLSCTKHRGLVDSLEYFGRRIFSEDTSTYKVVRRGDFAYATNHIEEGSIGYQNLHDAALISPMYTVFRTRAGVDHSFFFKLLKTELYRHIFEANTNGTINRRGALRWDDFARIKVHLPGEPEQRRIAAVLETADHEIQLLQKQLDALKEQKRGLMQKLLTGEIRVRLPKGART